MTRQISATPMGNSTNEHSRPVEELIKKLIRDGAAPSSEMVVARPVSIVEDESGGDPYNRTGRFRKIFK